MLKIEEILDKLIGHTDIWCETYYDNESYDNIENLFKVLQWALDRIEDNMRYLNRIEYSAQEIVRLTSAYWHNDCKLKTEKISELVNEFYEESQYQVYYIHSISYSKTNLSYLLFFFFFSQILFKIYFRHT